jgi:hypothetical protein
MIGIYGIAIMLQRFDETDDSRFRLMGSEAIMVWRRLQADACTRSGGEPRKLIALRMSSIP